MPVNLTDTRTQADLIREAREAVIDGLNQENVLGQAGDRAVINIRARTKAGLDRSGNRFAAYRESTKRKKRKKGQRLSPPTLTDSGVMLDDLAVTEVNGYWGTNLIVAEVGFASRQSENIARFHIEGTRYMVSRDFMGLTDEAEANLNEFIGAETKRLYPKDRRRRVRLQLIKVRRF